jgi:hypothetical protein
MCGVFTLQREIGPPWSDNLLARARETAKIDTGDTFNCLVWGCQAEKNAANGEFIH